MSSVSEEVAIEEINGWLDKCRFRKRSRESNKEYIDQLVDAVMDGDLIVDEETKELTMNLAHPIGESNAFKTLTFKTDLKVKEIRLKMKSGNVKPGDSDGRILAYAAALTSQPFSVVDSMSTVDQGLASSIAIFFF